MLAAESVTRRLLGHARVPGSCSAVPFFSCQHNKRTRRRDGGRLRRLVSSAAPPIITGPMTTSAVAFHSSVALTRPVRWPIVLSSTNCRLASRTDTLALRCSARLLSSGTHPSLLGDDGFDPFVTHHNADDAARADRMVRDYVKRRLAAEADIVKDGRFLGGALNSYRFLSEKAAEQTRGGWARRPDASFAKKADDLLAFVEHAYAQDHTLLPNGKAYSMVVDAYAKAGDPESAEAVLLRLEKLWRSGNEKVKPDRVLYNSVIDAWAKSGRKEAPKRAEAILHHMEQLNQKGHEGVRPDFICYNSVINAWAKSREHGAAQRAEAILNHMLKLYESGREECLPDTTCFTTAIDGWARSKDKDATKRAEALLEKMEELHRQGYKNILPNAESYNAVITSFARSRDPGAPKRAEDLLRKMEELYRQGNPEVRPSTISYNSVMNAWAKSGEKGAAQRAEAILHHMLKLYEGGREDCLPTDISFSSVIDAWAKSGDAKAYNNASRVFNLLQNAKEKGYGDIKASNITYNALMNALAVSSIPDKAPRAYKMLLEMEQRGKDGKASLAPNTQSYGTVLKVCARAAMSKSPKCKDEALRIALITFEKLRNDPDVPTDPYKYAPLFTIIDCTTKGERYEKLTSEVFRLCCEDGVLTDKQLENLRRYALKDVYRKLVGTSTNLTVRDLPPEWSRNNRQR